VLATADGQIWKLDSELHPLFSHEAFSQLAISPGGTVLASVSLDGSLVVYDLVGNRVLSRATAHRAVALSAVWWSDVLLTSGSDGAIRQWSLASGGLQLRGQAREATPVQFVRVIADGWVYIVNGATLSIERAGRAAVRLDLARQIQAIAVSPDKRYVAASVTGEIVVVDVRADKLAALAIETPPRTAFEFLDATSLAVVSAAGLGAVRVDDLDYERF
jgi:WD40 repeat protein